MSVSSVLSVIASQYDSVAGRSEFIGLAGLRVNRCVFGDKADLATAYVAAHMIALSTPEFRQEGAVGAITSKREGDLSISFAAGSEGKQDDGDFGQTHFGRQFLSLQNSSEVFVGVLGGADSGCHRTS